MRRTILRKRQNEAALRFLPIEAMESRVLFSTYTVLTLGDGNGAVAPVSGGNFQATTLRAAIAASNTHAGADTIQFSSKLKGTLSLVRPLPHINDKLAITGPGHKILGIRRSSAATMDFSIFRINAGRTASILGLKIYQGTGEGPNVQTGGNIYNLGNLNLYACTISGGTAERGGGIYNSGSLKVFNSTIQANTSKSSGGGIFNEGTLQVSGCSFLDNFAVSRGVVAGGGIASESGSINVVGSTFRGNGARTGLGGGIFCRGIADITDCNFEENFAKFGGGVYNAGSASLSRVRMVGNTAGADGGAIATSDHLTLRQSHLLGNTANGRGGGIYSSFVTSLRDSEISTGSAGTGGAVYLAGGLCSMLRMEFGANVADSGGAIYNNAGGQDQDIVECSFHGNSAFNDGGAIYNSVNASILMTRSLVYASSAFNGGGIMNLGKLDLSNCTLTGNDADSNNSNVSGSGGAISSEGAATLTNCTITGNHARLTGGGLLVAGSFVLNNTIVDGNFLSSDSSSTQGRD